VNSQQTLAVPGEAAALNRSTALDSLRGVAAIAVLLYHARLSLWVGASETYRNKGLSFDFNAWMGYLSVPLGYGSLGVTLFFVLSGYCIHRSGAKLIANGRSDEMNWSDFAKRRFWRIYPTYIAALLLTAGIDYLINAQFGLINTTQDNSLYAFGVSLLTLQGYVASFFGSNGVFWTLAMEIHLYAVYPLLFYATKRFGPNRVILAVFMLSFGYSLLEFLFAFESVLPFRFQRGPIFVPYWFTWTIGFYLAEVEANRAKSLTKRVWMAMITVSLPTALILTTKGQHLFAEVFWAIVFAGVVQGSLGDAGKRFWSGGIGMLLAWFGIFSYSLYAIHAPLLLLYHSVISPSNNEHKFETLWPAIGGVVLVIPVAYCFFRLVESWSIKKSASVLRRSILLSNSGTGTCA